MKTVDLIGYADDCRMRGRLELSSGRLSDALGDSCELRIQDVFLESLEDGHAVQLDALDLEPCDLCAVVGTGPRGEPLRRRRTLRSSVVLDVGPYRVRGELHVLAGSDPLAWLARRPGFAALSDARVSFRLAGEALDDRRDTLLVNASRITAAHLA